jgi:4'-phosphopantetheinyl transferase
VSQVDVWEIPLTTDSRTLQAVAGRLSATERERAHRLIDPEHGKRKMVSQWATREVLSWYLEVAPEEVQLELDPEGKPRLAEPVEWRFNLTHSEDWGLLAVSREEVGVDLEFTGRPLDCQGLARRFFSEREARSVESVSGSERVFAFFQIWTLKEAYVKATGRGLRLPLDNFCVFDEARWGLFTLTGQPLPGWFGCRLEECLDLPQSYRAALVCPHAAVTLDRYRYQPFIRIC